MSPVQEFLTLKRLIKVNGCVSIDNALRGLKTVEDKLFERDMILATRIQMETEIMKIKEDGNLWMVDNGG